MAADVEVTLHTSPWLSGPCAEVIGPIASELFLQNDQVEDPSSEWVAATLELLEGLGAKARLLGANAVFGLEIKIDPFAVLPAGACGLLFQAAGTAARLESLR